MTILNWRLRPDRALVLSDTLSMAVDTPGISIGFIAKALALPHIGAVVAAILAVAQAACDETAEILGLVSSRS